MKKILIFIILYYLYNNSFAQKKGSIETNFGYRYFFLGNENKNYFNYEGNFLFSKYLKKIKISSGIGYGTKFYYEKNSYLHEPTLVKIDRKIKEIYFPIIIQHAITSEKIINVKFLFGGFFNKIISYSITKVYFNKNNIYEHIDLNHDKLGFTLTCGTAISKPICNNMAINFSPVINYKIIFDQYSQRPNYRNLPDDKISLGLKMGLELFLR